MISSTFRNKTVTVKTYTLTNTSGNIVYSDTGPDRSLVCGFQINQWVKGNEGESQTRDWDARMYTNSNPNLSYITNRILYDSIEYEIVSVVNVAGANRIWQTFLRARKK